MATAFGTNVGATLTTLATGYGDASGFEAAAGFDGGTVEAPALTATEFGAGFGEQATTHHVAAPGGEW